jgi:hypothetical protein
VVGNTKTKSKTNIGVEKSDIFSNRLLKGAVSVAAAMFNKVPVKGKKTVCLVSGGNIDVTILSRVISRGMAKSGRTYAVTLDLIDKPGQLLGVSKIASNCSIGITLLFLNWVQSYK